MRKIIYLISSFLLLFTPFFVSAYSITDETYFNKYFKEKSYTVNTIDEIRTADKILGNYAVTINMTKHSSEEDAKNSFYVYSETAADNNFKIIEEKNSNANTTSSEGKIKLLVTTGETEVYYLYYRINNYIISAASNSENIEMVESDIEDFLEESTALTKSTTPETSKNTSLVVAVIITTILVLISIVIILISVKINKKNNIREPEKVNK